jgi:serine phosphatase RsbU (regulator of sigma subunit)
MAIVALMVAADLALGARVALVGTLVLAPAAAALFGRPRETLLVAVMAIAAAAASGSWNDNFGNLDYWVRLGVIAAGAVFAWVSARLQATWSATAEAYARANEERAAIGDVLQRGLMPPPVPETPGWSVGTLFRPGGAHNVVGGDFYDVFPFGTGWMAVVGDITGRGAGAASVTAQARHSLRTSRAFTNDPQEVLAALNEALLNREEAELCSLLAFFFGEGESVQVALAGHPPPLLVAGGSVQEVGETGPLLGAFPGAHWPFESVEVGAGRHLVGYTDGVTELEGEDDRFEVERLRRAVEPTRGPAGAIAAIERAMEAFAGTRRFEDDVTLLAVGQAPLLLEAAGDDKSLGA